MDKKKKSFHKYDFKKQLHKRMKDDQIDQAALSKILQVSQTSVSYLLSGKREPGPDVSKKLTSYLGHCIYCGLPVN